MALEIGKNSEEVPQDSSKHAKPWSIGKYGESGDILLVPGVGVCLSRSAVNDYESEARRIAAKHGIDKFHPYHQIVICEDDIRKWVATFDKNRSMEQVAEAKRSQVHDHEQHCYPGTDTQDPKLDSSKYKIHKNRNQYDLDKSESTIGIHVASGNRYLNGSMVKHHHYVRIEFNTPDGRRYGEVCLTFDQFASALVSNSSTPCTWDNYWGIEKDSILLREVVHKPQSIDERMAERLNDRLNSINERFDALQAKLDEKIESGKAMSKTNLAEVRRELDLLRSALQENRNFTVEQSREEVTSIVEQAAISIALSNNLSAEEIISNAHMGPLLETIVKRKNQLITQKKPETLAEQVNSALTDQEKEEWPEEHGT